MTEQLGLFLEEIGFVKIPSNLPEFTIYFQLENNFVNVIHVIDCMKGKYISEDQYEHIKSKIYKLFEEKHFVNIHILSLLIGADDKSARSISKDDSFCWLVDSEQKRLVIYENQVADFYGIKKKLEDWLNGGCIVKEIELEKKKIGNKTTNKTTKKMEKKFSPYITIILTVVNILIFLICTYTGEMLYNKGALNGPDVLVNGEYYRFITAMFLHGSGNHLFSNMLILFFLGEMIERKLGHMKFTILYFFSGIGGGWLSIAYGYYISRFVDSIGASGAIFGIIGALLYLVIANKGRLDTITLPRVIFMISYSIYSGFASTNVDNAAHIGGLCSGFLMAIILYNAGTRTARN